jgi:MFS family permease
MVVALIVMVMGYAVRNTFSVFYPAIVNEFGWGRGDTALMFSLSVIVYGAMAPVAGSLVQRFNPRVVLSIGAFVMGGGLALCSLASAQWHFYLVYGVIVATGLSMVGWTPLITVVSRWFIKERGMVFGIISAGFGVSLVSASVAQYLISSFGWRLAYVIIGLAAIAIIVPLSTLLTRSREGKAQPASDTANHSPAEQPGAEIRVPSESAASWSSTDWTYARAIRTYRFWLLFAISFLIMGIGQQTIIAHQVYFFRDVGYAPMIAATIYGVCGIAQVGGNFGCFLSDRLGREQMFIPGCLLCAGAVSTLLLIQDASHPWMPFIFAVCYGLGMGVASTLVSVTAADLFHGKAFGSIQGTIMFGFSMGGAISPWLAGFLHDRSGSYSIIFSIVVGSLLVCAFLMWLIAPRKIRPVKGFIS